MPVKKINSYQKKGSVAVIALVLFLLAGSAVVIVRKTGQKKVVPAPTSAPVVVPVEVTGVPTLSFNTEPGEISAGQDFDLVLAVNPSGVEFHAFELYVTYDPAQVEPQTVVNPVADIISGFPLISANFDENRAMITVIGTRTGDAFAGSSKEEIARIKLKSKVASAAELDFSYTEASKLGNKLTPEKSSY